MNPNKLATLIREAKASAKFRGHTFGRWNKSRTTTAPKLTPPAMSPKSLSCLCLMSLLVFAMACSQKQAVVGYWQFGEAQSFWEFKSDGVCMTHGESASKVTGRYSFPSRNKLKIELTGAPHPMMLLVKISGDQMTLTEGHTAPMKLHRVDPSKIKPELSFEEEMRSYLEPPRAATNSPRQ